MSRSTALTKKYQLKPRTTPQWITLVKGRVFSVVRCVRYTPKAVNARRAIPSNASWPWPRPMICAISFKPA